MDDPVLVYTVFDLSRFLLLDRATDALKYYKVCLEAQALTLLRGGSPVPGQRIGHGAGSTVWNKSAPEVLALGDLMGVQLRKPEAPLTPLQAEKAGVDKALLAPYSMYKSGKARLVPDDDNKARQIFGGNPVCK